MKQKLIVVLIFVGTVVLISALLVRSLKPKSHSDSASREEVNVASRPAASSAPTANGSNLQASHLPANPSVIALNSSPSAMPSQIPNPVSIALSANNFESFVSKCFQGEPCTFAEDPRKMLADFKLAGNRAAMDNLISFLRARMRDPGDREKYKDVLKTMIDEFYPAKQKQFQEAAYYN